MGIHGFMGQFVPFKGRKLTPKTDGMTTSAALVEERRVASINEKYASVRKSNVGVVHILHVDINSLCYKALDPIYGMGSFSKTVDVSKVEFESLHSNCYNLIFKLFQEMVKEIAPTEEVTINFDGPVPVAKMWQQKQRRYESSMSLSKDSHFDRAALTPGSTWMKGLMNHFRRKLQSDEILETLPPKVTFSSDLVQGEGEHKIMKRIRQQTKDKRTVFYGQDSDIVLLCLLAVEEGYINLSICDDFKSELMKQYYDLAKVDVYKRDLKNNSYLSIGQLSNALSEELGQKPGSIKDFIFCCSLIGNDFIPRPYSMSSLEHSLERILDAIREVEGRVISNDGTVSWFVFYQLLGLIVGDQGLEEMVLCTKAKINRSMEHTGIWFIPEGEDATTEDYEKLFRQFIDLQSTWYTNALCPIVETDRVKLIYADIAEMCVAFLQGISWTYQYYFKGMDSVNWNWYYPYSYSPFLVDVHQALGTIISKGYSSHVVPYDDTRTNCMEQLVAVMPHYSLQWVPEQLQFLWSEQSPIADMFPQGLIVDKDGLEADEVSEKKKVFEGKIEEAKLITASKDYMGVKILPTIQMSRIRAALLSSTYEWDKYLNEKEIKYERKIEYKRGNVTVSTSRGRGMTRGVSGGRGMTRGR